MGQPVAKLYSGRHEWGNQIWRQLNTPVESLRCLIEQLGKGDANQEVETIREIRGLLSTPHTQEALELGLVSRLCSRLSPSSPPIVQVAVTETLVAIADLSAATRTSVLADIPRLYRLLSRPHASVRYAALAALGALLAPVAEAGEALDLPREAPTAKALELGVRAGPLEALLSSLVSAALCEATEALRGGAKALGSLRGCLGRLAGFRARRRSVLPVATLLVYTDDPFATRAGCELLADFLDQAPFAEEVSERFLIPAGPPKEPFPSRLTTLLTHECVELCSAAVDLTKLLLARGLFVQELVAATVPLLRDLLAAPLKKRKVCTLVERMLDAEILRERPYVLDSVIECGIIGDIVVYAQSQSFNSILRFYYISALARICNIATSIQMERMLRFDLLDYVCAEISARAWIGELQILLAIFRAGEHRQEREGLRCNPYVALFFADASRAAATLIRQYEASESPYWMPVRHYLEAYLVPPAATDTPHKTILDAVA
eukprot:Protomagalhaensia_sp_Gyna_25__1092@NODE_1531_length_1760_cov_4_803021_g1243_i0_p1_GENE_NODE_1531_length_1760_cov_4_803021_g1243_i0NODE_1531_length_1760_cov_4_803021_g1243_i0_p1_ORF_typecomplete_len493_score70_89Cnd1/PF12717_7/1_8e02Cnd1/PF12717_7/0_11Cnd1/PF12717_7/1_8e03HEAT/PF02985_22/0_048SAPS/PF04499_15/0_028HEAT_EZ/PF13513_6/6_2e03HEAT_EZ/PF13513_6/0_018HEAT_EZ/PF13513_6/2_1e03L27/PF02828_16/1_5L27/PF02828_16/82Arm_2/PF04826_13/0_11Arm_2/PF04826_13/1_7e03HEAT_2/PF13646_6/3_7e02HEAT_2/PF1364